MRRIAFFVLLISFFCMPAYATDSEAVPTDIEGFDTAIAADPAIDAKHCETQRCTANNSDRHEAPHRQVATANGLLFDEAGNPKKGNSSTASLEAPQKGIKVSKTSTSGN